ncbi:MAG: hypothetical protein NVSMB62_01240 [Acidobacteriaceae bacterium]
MQRIRGKGIEIDYPAARSHASAVDSQSIPTSTKKDMQAPPLSTKHHGLRARVQSYVSRIADNRRKVATVGAALLAVGVAYHVAFGPNGLTVYDQKRHETRSLETQVKQLQHENELLKGHVDRLQSDPGAIEHEAREQLHYARPGEVIYTLGSSSTQSQTRSEK